MTNNLYTNRPSDVEFVHRKIKKVLLCIYYKNICLIYEKHFYLSEVIYFNKISFYIQNDFLYTLIYIEEPSNFKRLIYLSGFECLDYKNYAIYITIHSLKDFKKYVRIVEMFDELKTIDFKLVEEFFNKKGNK